MQTEPWSIYILYFDYICIFMEGITDDWKLSTWLLNIEYFLGDKSVPILNKDHFIF